jgi:hypothetical protein
VRDLDDLTSTPGGAAAVAIDRGDMSAAELAQHRLKQETDRAEHLYTELRSAPDSGALNRSGSIRLEVVEAAVEELTGRRAPRSRPDDVPAAIADRAEGKRPRAEHEPDGPPLYITADEDPDDD